MNVVIITVLGAAVVILLLMGLDLLVGPRPRDLHEYDNYTNGRRWEVGVTKAGLVHHYELIEWWKIYSTGDSPTVFRGWAWTAKGAEKKAMRRRWSILERRHRAALYDQVTTDPKTRRVV